MSEEDRQEIREREIREAREWIDGERQYSAIGGFPPGVQREILKQLSDRLFYEREYGRLY